VGRDIVSREVGVNNVNTRRDSERGAQYAAHKANSHAFAPCAPSSETRRTIVRVVQCEPLNQGNNIDLSIKHEDLVGPLFLRSKCFSALRFLRYLLSRR
jgi:hypothetical protein